MAVDMKPLIAKNLLEMLKTKHLEKITIKELVDACGISRQAFYYHFKDILDVLAWWAQEQSKMLVAASLAAENMREGVEVFLDSAIQGREIVRSLLGSRWRAQMEAMMVNMVSSYLREMLQKTHPDVALSPANLDAYIHFHSYGLVGMIFEYIVERNADRDFCAEQLCWLISRQDVKNAESSKN